MPCLILGVDRAVPLPADTALVAGQCVARRIQRGHRLASPLEIPGFCLLRSLQHDPSSQGRFYAAFLKWGYGKNTRGKHGRASSLGAGASLSGARRYRVKQADMFHQCPQRNRHESWPRLASSRGVHMQPQAQKKLARADRIQGSIVLYRPAARSQSNTQRPLSRGERWWNMVFGVPLFLRTLFRLVFVCLHRHRGPPITPRVAVPSNLLGRRTVFGRETYIVCLDCGKKFAYNYKTRQLVDFWGVHDAEALAGFRRRVDEFFSPLQSLAAQAGRLNVRNSMGELVQSLHPLGILTKGQAAKSER